MNTSFLDQLTEVNQYARLIAVHENLSALQGQHVEHLIQMVGILTSQGDSKTALEIAEISVLCAIALDDNTILAEALTEQARVSFANAYNQAAIHLSLQALNCLKREMDTLTEIREFFIVHDFEFGMALVDEKIAAVGLEPIHAIERLDFVERVYEQAGYQLGLGYVFLHKAAFYKFMDSLEEALTCYLKSYRILSDFQMCITELLIDLSYVYSQLNQLDEAKYYISEAERIFQQEENDLGLASVYFNRAANMRRRQQNRNLVRLYRQAYELFLGHEQIEDVAFVEMNVATLLMQYPGHQEQSLRFLESARDRLANTENQQLLARVTAYLALLLLNMGKDGQSKELLLSVADGAFSDVPTETKWQVLYTLGGLEFRDGNLGQAYDYYRSAVEVIASIRSRLRTEEFIIDFIDRKPDFYGPLVMLANEMGKPIDAFGWVEQARSRAFLHILGNVRHTLQTDVDTTLVEELRDIDRQITILEQAVKTDGAAESQAVLALWQRRLDELIVTRRNLDRLRKFRSAEVRSMVEVQPMDWREILACLSA